MKGYANLILIAILPIKPRNLREPLNEYMTWHQQDRALRLPIITVFNSHQLQNVNVGASTLDKLQVVFCFVPIGQHVKHCSKR